MKIILPVNEANLESEICVSFGRTPYFLLVDSETMSFEVIDNSEAADSIQGAGILAAQVVADHQADVLITPRCGEKAMVVFEEVELKIMKSIKENAYTNIQAYLNGELNILEEKRVA